MALLSNAFRLFKEIVDFFTLQFKWSTAIVCVAFMHCKWAGTMGYDNECLAQKLNF